MLKNHEGSFSLLQKLADAFVISLAWFISYQLRFKIMSGGETGLSLFFVKLTPGLIVLNYYFFRRNGLYNSQRFNSRYQEIAAVFKANSFSFISFVIALYFISPDRVSRITLGYYFVISSFSLVALRISIRNFLRRIRRKGHNLRHYLLVGNGPQMLDFIDKIKMFKDSGINLIGWIDANNETKFSDVKRLDTTLDHYLKTNNPDAIIFGYPAKDFHQTETMLKKFHNNIYNLIVLPDLSYSFIGHNISEFAGIPLITINSPGLSTFDVFLKRGFDFLTSLIGIIIISPLLILLSILVKLTSPGPIFYGQERMGLDGKSFRMWKFRSMRADAEQTGAGWTVENDPRRTKFGTFLRETSLDELPQLFNVLLGDMSLVGPRPERPVYVEKFKEEIPAYMLRHKMKAGITGWAQVNGWRGNTSLEKRIECDIFYIKNWSLWFDIKILFLTFFKGFINKNAY
jgi:exopolysaccharide biosynthesis polyprenyl glycosylphosphotransferase